MRVNNNNLVLFFDGCHKIYYAERTDQETIDKMIGYGYRVAYNDFNTTLDQYWRESCGLKFISPANLDQNLPSVEQFQKGGMRGFKTKLANYYKGIANESL